MSNEIDVIDVQGLSKTYGAVQAMADISFQVRRNEIFGMVGPNGSGKTTTIECIEGLRRPDRGQAWVLGYDTQRQGAELREQIGIQLQSANLPHRMRVEEALKLFASFYRHADDWGGLLEELGLARQRRAFCGQLSGGQKQRLSIALALINHPQVVFLDELTTGLDPQARRATWDLVRDIQGRGATVFLTTHFMEEAERLCNRVAILDHGRIIALDTPQALVNRLGTGMRIVFRIAASAAPGLKAARIGSIQGVQRVEQHDDEVLVYGQGQGLVGAVIRALEAAGLPVNDLRTEQANLEDAYLALTGQAIRD